MLINYNVRQDDIELSDTQNELCSICYDNIDIKKNEDITILKCGHKFHYNCILLTYKNTKSRRECPYCRGDGGYLLLKPGIIPMNHIHKEYKEYNNGNKDIVKFIPKQILHATARVMAFILAALATQFIIDGIKASFNI